MRVVTTALLLCSKLLTNCVAKHSGSNVVQFQQPLSLDIDGEYSQADLEKLYKERDEMSLEQSKVTTTVLEKPTEAELTKASTELEFKDDKAWKAIDIRGSAAITYSAGCWDNLFVKGNYTVHMRFDGKIARWRRGQNIDGFGYISISGHGNPYRSNADYHHVVCQAPNTQTICTYYHFGIITSEIHTRNEPQYIKFGAIQRDVHLPKYRQPHVIQTCKPISKGVKRAPCPQPDPSVWQNWCSLSKIDVTTTF